jgi:hypothetical protein
MDSWIQMGLVKVHLLNLLIKGRLQGPLAVTGEQTLDSQQ